MAQGYDPTDTREREQEKREAEARARMLREQEIADLKWLMSSRRGRRLVWRLMRMARVFQLSFHTNAMQMAFNEGNRSLGNQLLDEVMNLCPEQFPTMMKEQQDGNGNRDGSGDQSN